MPAAPCCTPRGRPSEIDSGAQGAGVEGCPGSAPLRQALATHFGRGHCCFSRRCLCRRRHKDEPCRYPRAARARDLAEPVNTNEAEKCSMNQPCRYKNPPIEEALCEFHFNPGEGRDLTCACHKIGNYLNPRLIRRFRVAKILMAGIWSDSIGILRGVRTTVEKAQFQPGQLRVHPTPSRGMTFRRFQGASSTGMKKLEPSFLRAHLPGHRRKRREARHGHVEDSGFRCFEAGFKVRSASRAREPAQGGASGAFADDTRVPDGLGQYFVVDAGTLVGSTEFGL